MKCSAPWKELWTLRGIYSGLKWIGAWFQALESPVNCRMHVLGTEGGSCRTQTEPSQTPCTQRGYKPRALLLGGDSSNHCTTVPPIKHPNIVLFFRGRNYKLPSTHSSHSSCCFTSPCLPVLLMDTTPDETPSCSPPGVQTFWSQSDPPLCTLLCSLCFFKSCFLFCPIKPNICFVIHTQRCTFTHGIFFHMVVFYICNLLFVFNR